MKSTLYAYGAGLGVSSLVALGLYVFGVEELRGIFGTLFTVKFTLSGACFVGAVKADA